MEAAENQLEAVRKSLATMTKQEWSALALAAQTTERTLYNLVNPARKPGYETVYRVYAALKARQPEPVK